MMRKFYLSLAVAAVLGAATMLVQPAAAGPAGVTGQLGALAGRDSLIEQAQFFYGGRRYCWYSRGWHGPGWYRCGYAWRRGYGWGGVYGWHGWRRPHVRHHRPRHHHRSRHHRSHHSHGHGHRSRHHH